jgi:hypothetical protein
VGALSYGAEFFGALLLTGKMLVAAKVSATVQILAA